MHFDRKAAAAGWRGLPIYTENIHAEEKMTRLVRPELVVATDEDRFSLFLQLRDQGSSRGGGNRQVCVSLRRATHSIRIAAPQRAVALISRSSPPCRSTPVSVQGWAVEMVKE